MRVRIKMLRMQCPILNNQILMWPLMVSLKKNLQWLNKLNKKDNVQIIQTPRTPNQVVKAKLSLTILWNSWWIIKIAASIEVQCLTLVHLNYNSEPKCNFMETLRCQMLRNSTYVVHLKDHGIHQMINRKLSISWESYF